MFPVAEGGMGAQVANARQIPMGDFFDHLNTNICEMFVSFYFSKQLWESKIRSPAHAVTDWIYCLELPGSPRPQATGFLGVPGSKSSQLLHGRDFLILFHHFSKQNRTFL